MNRNPRAADRRQISNRSLPVSGHWHPQGRMQIVELHWSRGDENRVVFGSC